MRRAYALLLLQFEVHDGGFIGFNRDLLLHGLISGSRDFYSDSFYRGVQEVVVAAGVGSGRGRRRGSVADRGIGDWLLGILVSDGSGKDRSGMGGYGAG